MTNAKKVLVNTLAQYFRTVLNILLALYSTRIILTALGTTDFGLYSLIAGVVSMLSFVSNALVISTQRFLSFYHGEKDSEKIKMVFSNSIFIHAAIGIIVLVILVSLKSIVINDLLSIPIERKDAALWVYVIVVSIISLTFLTSPFRSLYVARENIIYTSIVDVADGALKLVSAILLTIVLYDRLITYAVLLFCIALFNLFVFGIYAFIKYEECHIPRMAEINRTCLIQILGFASWTLFNIGSVIGRTQGVAIVINHYFSAVLNASYGIAQQVLSALATLSSAIANAMSPQIIKAEGGGQREKMLLLAGLSSKYGFLMLSIFAIPIIFEFPVILKIWLGNPPENVTMFCRYITIAALIDQITAGLGTANQAIGKIKLYSIVLGTLKLLTIPMSILLIHFYYDAIVIMICFVVMELISTISRIFFLKWTAGLSIKLYLLRTVYPALVPSILSVIACLGITVYFDSNFRIMIMLLVSGLVIGVTSYLLMNVNERDTLCGILKRK